ncbi:uncharacterized protein CIMG_13025 [Coccidioides immitis RS]|uniref:Uncharacterized protein n=1 Tax=Coccidioides immitis (strain RS) TaxID=246410 RepID=A0A0D8JW65_COCIM|nr:uncharacterized protein CIMG_13025 [Coccidioides immitis RS]KJF60528.1 hypothetical protein CIMG_13025 [Coccidioides immitis RS]
MGSPTTTPSILPCLAHPAIKLRHDLPVECGRGMRSREVVKKIYSWLELRSCWAKFVSEAGTIVNGWHRDLLTTPFFGSFSSESQFPLDMYACIYVLTCKPVVIVDGGMQQSQKSLKPPLVWTRSKSIVDLGTSDGRYGAVILAIQDPYGLFEHQMACVKVGVRAGYQDRH